MFDDANLFFSGENTLKMGNNSAYYPRISKIEGCFCNITTNKLDDRIGYNML